MNRRQLFGGIGGLLGWLGFAKTAHPKQVAPQVKTDFKRVLPQEFCDFKKEMDNYVLLMLGAPVVTIELDQQQLDLCFWETFEDFGEDVVGRSLFKRGMLARAKIILGRIRINV